MATFGNDWVENIGGYAPMASGGPFQPQFGTEGVPFMGQGGLPGMAMNFLGMPYARSLMDRQGMMPYGFHDQNAADFIRNRAFQADYRRSMQAMHVFESQNAHNLLAGVTEMAGGPKYDPTSGAPLADRAADVMTNLAMIAPQLVEGLNGPRGSASVMAMNMHMGSRYRLNAQTGELGMRQDQVEALAGRLYQETFGVTRKDDGKLRDNFDLRNTQGFTAGQYGELYNAMGSRGMLMGRQRSMEDETRGMMIDMTPTQRREAMKQAEFDPDRIEKVDSFLGGLEKMKPNERRKAIERAKKETPELLSDDDLNRLRSTGEVGGALKEVDFGRIKESLKKQIDVVSAMRDIMGDAGHPNAPMSELMAGLDKLTLGMSHQLDPSHTARMVRDMRAMSSITGLPMDAMVAMENHAASRLEAMGGSAAQAMPIAFGAAAWGAAAQSGGISATPSWGRLNLDQFRQVDVNLRAAAGVSDRANRMNALMRLREMSGGQFEDAKLQELSNAIERGDTAALDTNALKGGNFEKAILNSRDASRLGLTGGSVRAMLVDRKANEEYGVRYGTANQVRAQQGEEFRGWLGKSSITALKQQIIQASGGKISAAEATKIAQAGGAQFAEKVANMTDAQMSDSVKRNEMFGTFLQEATAGTAAEGLFAAPDRARVQGSLLGGSLDQASKIHFKGRTLQNQVAAFNPERMAQAERIQAQANYERMRDEAMAPVGRGGILSKLVDKLERDPKDLAEVTATLFGGINQGDLAGPMKDVLQDLVKGDQELQAITKQLNDPTTSKEKRKELQKQMAEKRRFVAANANRFYKEAEDAGLQFDPNSGIAYKKEEGLKQADKARDNFSKYLDAEIKKGEKGGYSEDQIKKMETQKRSLGMGKGILLGDDTETARGIYQKISGIKDETEKKKAIAAAGFASEDEFKAQSKKFGWDKVGKGEKVGPGGPGGFPTELKLTGEITLKGADKVSLSATGTGATGTS